jgi:hypothetical protein
MPEADERLWHRSAHHSVNDLNRTATPGHREHGSGESHRAGLVMSLRMFDSTMGENNNPRSALQTSAADPSYNRVDPASRYWEKSV